MQYYIKLGFDIFTSAKYCAQDGDGNIYYFEDIPTPSTCYLLNYGKISCWVHPSKTKHPFLYDEIFVIFEFGGEYNINADPPHWKAIIKQKFISEKIMLDYKSKVQGFLVDNFVLFSKDGLPKDSVIKELVIDDFGDSPVAWIAMSPSDPSSRGLLYYSKESADSHCATMNNLLESYPLEFSAEFWKTKPLEWVTHQLIVKE